MSVTFKEGNGTCICFGISNNIESRYYGSYGTSESKEFAGR